jgi:anti-sigma factor RsiW
MTTLNPADFELLQAYLDQELPGDERLAFEARLTGDPTLAAALAAEQRLRLGLRVRLRQTRAPATLRASVTAVRPSVAGESFWSRWVAWWSTPRRISPALGAVSLLVVFLVAVLLGRFSGLGQPLTPADDHTVFRQLAGRHAVYLQNKPLPLDVRGQPAEVAAWFASRVSFPVSIPVLAGWQLEGGRLGEYHHQAAVHLVYDRNGEHVSLTEFTPQATDFPPTARQQVDNRDFYRGNDGQRPVIVWRQGELGYALVGNPSVSSTELLTIALDVARQLDHQ